MASNGAPTSGALTWLASDAARSPGVARGLARRLGAHVLVVRVAFVVLALAGGAGVVLYGVAWALTVGRPVPAPDPQVRNDVAVVLLTSAVLHAATVALPWLPAPLLWLIALAALGMSIAGASTVSATGVEGALAGDAALRSAPVRAGVGVVLVVAAVATALAGAGDLSGLWTGTLTLVALGTGLAIVVAPWLGRLTATAEHERRERMRTEERADIAAHLHDSVLQTLTLIQNRADEPQVVAALAHRQERALRRWLYEGAAPAPGAGPPSSATLRDLVEAAAVEVEDQYLVAVETIVAGDHPGDALVAPLVAALREALVNAAKFSGSTAVSVFVDVDDRQVAAYVRDRGQGFDRSLVPADRRGIAESIIGRLERAGGSATVRTAPGAGTEVAMVLPFRPRSGPSAPAAAPGSSASAPAGPALAGQASTGPGPVSVPGAISVPAPAGLGPAAPPAGPPPSAGPALPRRADSTVGRSPS